MKIKNIKNLFITSLISSVSFLLNILPVRAGEAEITLPRFGQDSLAGDLITPPGHLLLSLFLGFILLPLSIIIIIFFIVRFLKKREKAKKASKPKKRAKKK